ncbi:unnamed protein product [Protopolystoma xenopodis]|uniref:Uncharacterized protein n=1 Tax=Protopolystoma xenopodis TaxID=117903 RepID=A0A3S5BGB8_9PLAT|nr:unnamed protein product [Protopolystoma xenopodis]
MKPTCCCCCCSKRLEDLFIIFKHDFPDDGAGWRTEVLFVQSISPESEARLLPRALKRMHLRGICEPVTLRLPASPTHAPALPKPHPNSVRLAPAGPGLSDDWLRRHQQAGRPDGQANRRQTPPIHKVTVLCSRVHSVLSSRRWHDLGPTELGPVCQQNHRSTFRQHSLAPLVVSSSSPPPVGRGRD